MKKRTELGNGCYMIEYDYGSKYWYRNDELDRDDGPAVVRADGSKEWWHNGQLHCVEYPDGYKVWYRNGKEQNSQNMKEIVALRAELAEQKRIAQENGELAIQRGQEIKRLEAENAELTRQIEEKDTELSAWHSVFQTSQLSHAQARLEEAEKQAERLKRKLDLSVADKVNADLPAGFKAKGKIKRGAIIHQDFHRMIWPRCKPVPCDTIFGDAPDPDMIFDVEWKNNKGENACWDCVAFGFGAKENYGNGSIFIFDFDGVEVISKKQLDGGKS